MTTFERSRDRRTARREAQVRREAAAAAGLERRYAVPALPAWLLALAADAAPATPATPAPAPAAGTALIVEADATTRSALRARLEALGWHCYSVATVDDALAMQPVVRADVVFVDLELADKAGLMLLRALRRLDPPARVVAHAAQPDRAMVAAAIAAGADDFLAKPFAEARLRAALAPRRAA